MHYNRWQRNGGPLVLRRSTKIVDRKGYLAKGHKPVHIEIAEKALGRPLPKGVVVHHADENKHNNENSNLVICPSHAYHMLLHRRLRAFKATGDANKRMCKLCHQWDDPENLRFSPSQYSGLHNRCDAADKRRRKAA